MAAHSHDDGFHEIQLSGKQLVFFFMAATVVLVVVFLCGVLVGRGVRVDRAGTLAEAGSTAPIEPAAAPPVPVSPPAGSDPTKAAPPAPSDDLSYPKSLQRGGQPAEILKASPKSERPAPIERDIVRTAPPAAAPPVAVAPPPAAKASTPVEPKAPKETPKEVRAVPPPPAEVPPPPASTSTPAPAPDAGGSFVVQVAAVNVRSEADAIAKRLASKGYDAYVMESTPGGAQMFRVRVGKFGTRREAQTMATKLQKEEQFKPWVTR